MKKILGGWSLRTMLIFFGCVSLVFTVVLVTISAQIYQQELRHNNQKSLELYYSEADRQLTAEMQDIRTALYSLANKQELNDYLEGDRGYRAKNVQYVAAQLKDLTNYVARISDVILATADGSIVAATSNSSNINHFLVRYRTIQSIKEQGVIGTVCYTYQTANREEYVLAVVVPIHNSGTEGILVGFSTLNDMVNGVPIFEKPCAIYDGEQLLYSNTADVPAPEEIRKIQAMQANGNYGEWLHLTMKMAGWNVLAVSPLIHEEDEMQDKLLRWNGVSLLIFAAIECLLIFFIYTFIIAPIRSISLQSTCINSTAATIDNPAPQRQELNTLVQNINAMVARTNNLTQAIGAAQMKLMEMEIQQLRGNNMLLQAQINPHFLYNMLECICGMAAQDGNGAIQEMTQLLAKMYRYCLKTPESTLGEELECLGLYERIMLLRYDQRFGFEVDVPEDLLLLPVPRMVLEPLVENSVQHGFVKNDDQHFFVRIQARMTENFLDVEIIDNGCGIAPERLQEINAQLETASAEQLPPALA